MLDPLFMPLLSFGLCLLLVHLLAPVARHLGLVDKPNPRKHHQGAVPLVGGIAMFLAFLFSVLLLPLPLEGMRSLLAGTAMMLVVGVLDDFHEISPNKRLLAQVVAALLICWGDGVVLRDLGALGPGGEVLRLGLLAVPFTVFGTVGVINALNMADGIDGLAGGLSLVSLGSLAWLAWSHGLPQHFYVLLLLVSVVLGFLLFNLPLPGRKQAQVFMGDSGSMFLGLVIAWFLIDLSQAPQRALNPVTALWLFALPLLDTVSVMLRRVLRGRSPFSPDREHFHHILLLAEFPCPHALLIMLSLASLLAAVGLIGEYLQISETLMLLGFLSLFAAYFFGMMHAWRVYRFLGRSLRPGAHPK